MSDPDPADEHEPFGEFVKREGPRIAKELRESQLRADSSEAARESPERTQEAAREIELRDEAEIVQEVQGRVTDEMFYRFALRGGGEVVGLSYAGTKAVARVMAASGEPLSVLELKVNDDGDHYTALAKCENLKTREVRWGVASQSKIMRTRKGDIEDEFALQKCVSKSQRNALRAHLPEVAITAAYREWNWARNQEAATR